MRFEPSTHKNLAAAAIILVNATAFYILFRGFVAGVHCHEADKWFREECYGVAENHLKKALGYRPGDDRIHKALGAVHLKLAGLSAQPREALFRLQAADTCYQRAAGLNRHDAGIVYSLARTAAMTDQVKAHRPGEQRLETDLCLKYYREAIRLRPNGILFHYALARELAGRNQQADLLPIIADLSRIYPPAYYHLRREPFWSSPVRTASLEGLEAAAAQGIRPRNAHFAISDIMADEKKWPRAISHFQEALEYKPFQNSSGDYLRLGGLFMQNNQVEDAEACFFHALKTSQSGEKDLERLFDLYKNRGRLNEFNRFLEQARGIFAISSPIDILAARALIDLGQCDRAGEILEAVNARNPRGDVYLWLSRIAEIEKDWDRQELAIQKATVLDPKNSHFHLCFSQVLNRLQKYERAEKEAGLAIKYADRSSPWLFNNRARVRWNRQDYLGAARDWQRAIRLSPDSADFHARVAESYARADQRELTIQYYRKAMELDRDNEQYKKAYQELMGQGGA